MTDARDLFYSRLAASWAKGLRYFLLIAGNGGMPVLLVLSGILLYDAYAAFLSWLPESFPAYVLIAAFISAVLTKTSVRTFIRQPDVVFLLPLEHHMGAYFRASLIYSAVVQVVFTAVAMGLLLPLYRVRIGDEASFAVSLAFVAIFQLWNVYAYWQELRLTHGRGKHIAFRFAVNVLLTGTLFYGGPHPLYTLMAAFMLLLATVHYSRLTQGGRFPWYRLVDLERKRRNTLYALTGFFVDVPHLQQQVKVRPWLAPLLSRIPFGQKNTYLYVYARTFARSGDYWSLYVRLTIVTAVVMAFVPNVYAVLAAYVIGLVLTGVQLPGVAKKHAHSIWFKVYPLDVQSRMNGLTRLVFALLAVQSVLLAFAGLLSTASLKFTAALLAVGWVFSYVFSYVYLPSRLHPSR
ncbi:ABC transporter permease [Novibacillus thermophilus]|uniref:ABC transporter permease n=1 Tax=Novibacillus thermophilus TaxID=1471761 RepID=A0A1U9K7X4_9BACL|nr:ABC transporter permease [Novibacillus thermophilus]AQS56155.1 hypothetical protein B0W44_10645 [Novibacillus thermophilus]